MRVNVSVALAVVLAAVMLGVIFGVLTDSRNSILIKEIFYVAGGSLAALLGGILLISGVPAHVDRLPRFLFPALASVILLTLLRHFTGIASVNGPFTFLMLLSLSVITFAGVLYLDRRELVYLTGLLVASSFLLFLYAVLQWQGVNIFQWDASLTRSGRSAGSLGNPNLLGGFASAVLPLGVSALLVWKKPGKTLRYLLAALFTAGSVAAVIASGTRGSLLGLAGGSVFITVWYIRRSGSSGKKLIPAALILGAVLAAAALPMSSRLSELDPGAEEQGTLQVRKLIWSGALSVFAESPLIGHGPGSFQILYPEHRDPEYSILGVSHNTLHAHCEYLEILVDLGLLGLVLWGAVLWFAAGALRRADALGAGAFAGLCAMLTEGLVSVHLRWPPTAWLFSFLAMIALSSAGERAVRRFKSLPRGIFLLLASFALIGGLFLHYIPAARSSELVFMGKDVFLNRTEAAMRNAYAAATQWHSTGDPGALEATLNYWSQAEAYADSAVDYSIRGTLAYPEDLGSWYALGSAHLTRYMVMKPPVQAVTAALDHAGIPNALTEEMLDHELELGMAAYDSLVRKAPNYAEVHNNLALGYSNMGRVDQALEELYLAYRLHAHRRADYFQQAVSLLPLSQGSPSGCSLVFSHVLGGFNAQGIDQRLERKLESLENHLSFIYASLPDRCDSLREEFAQIALEELPCGIAEQVEDRVRCVSPGQVFRWYIPGDISGTPAEILEQCATACQAAAIAGAPFPGTFPSERAFYILPVELLSQAGYSDETWNAAMEVFVNQIQIDRNLDAAYTLMMSDRFSEKVPSGVRNGIDQVRTALGGSRTALREGLDHPWLPGSLPGLLSDTLHALQQNDSLNGKWFVLEMELTFQVLSSYWWDYQIFSWPQNQYLLERVFHCRDRVMQLEPDRWRNEVSQVIDRVAERSRFFTGPSVSPQLDQLQGDLISGAARQPVDPPQ